MQNRSKPGSATSGPRMPRRRELRDAPGTDFMPWFRTPPPSTSPLPAANLRDVLADVTRPEHFLVGSGTRLEWESGRVETVPWELLHGRLLDAPMTRQQRTFESWNV